MKARVRRFLNEWSPWRLKLKIEEQKGIIDLIGQDNKILHIESQWRLQEIERLTKLLNQNKSTT